MGTVTLARFVSVWSGLEAFTQVATRLQENHFNLNEGPSQWERVARGGLASARL